MYWCQCVTFFKDDQELQLKILMTSTSPTSIKCCYMSILKHQSHWRQVAKVMTIYCAVKFNVYNVIINVKLSLFKFNMYNDIFVIINDKYVKNRGSKIVNVILVHIFWQISKWYKIHIVVDVFFFLKTFFFFYSQWTFLIPCFHFLSLK